MPTQCGCECNKKSNVFLRCRSCLFSKTSRKWFLLQPPAVHQLSRHHNLRQAPLSTRPRTNELRPWLLHPRASSSCEWRRVREDGSARGARRSTRGHLTGQRSMPTYWRSQDFGGIVVTLSSTSMIEDLNTIKVKRSLPDNDIIPEFLEYCLIILLLTEIQ